MTGTIYTIGYSNHSLEHFITLLKQHGINALCDVRSNPYSRMNPQFNREVLKQSLKENGIAYVFLGKELGARSEDPSCYVREKVQYDRLAQTALFLKGLDRVCQGIKEYHLALMCAEKDPLECHRTILVARHLADRGVAVEHILEDGSVENHEKALSRLLHQLNLPEQDMFRSHEDMIKDAYRIQGDRIAYKIDKTSAADAKAISGASR